MCTFPFQLKLEGTTAYVEVLLKLAGGKSVDLTEEVYSADVSVFQSMDFGPSKITDVPYNESIPSANLPLPLSIPSDTKPSEETSSAALPSPLTLPTSDIVSLLQLLELKVLFMYIFRSVT